MKLVRTFHPVGHGAFYTERFYDDDQNVANIVFDCGCYEGPKSGNSIQHYQKFINDIVDSVFLSSDDKIKVDALFISHFHIDHINGVKRVLKICDVKRIIMPKLTDDAYLFALLYSHFNLGCELNDMIQVLSDFKESLYDDDNDIEIIEVEIDEDEFVAEFIFEEKDIEQTKGPISKPTMINLHGIWKYIPFSTKENKHQLISSLRQTIPVLCPALSSIPINFTEIANKLTNNPTLLDQCKAVYESVFGDKYHNNYSMTLFSGTCESDATCVQHCHVHVNDLPRYCTRNCLYMGDYEADPKKTKKNTNCVQLLKFYGKYWKRIGLFQVPHHGSKDNINNDLYTPAKIALISAGNDDCYCHPSMELINALHASDCIPVIVTEKPESIKVFTYELA